MTDFEYRTIRSDRRSYSVTVRSDNQIVVRCPLRATEAQVGAFIASKRAWILRALAKNAAAESGFGGVRELEKMLVAGRLLPVSWGGRNFIDDEIASFSSKSAVKKTLVDHCSPKFFQIYEQVCAATGLRARSISFRSYKARWGCCDSRSRIVFNFKLLMLDEKFWRYVILHELCHTVYMNHSTAFYALMEKFMPRYKEVRKELKKFTFVAALPL